MSSEAVNGPTTGLGNSSSSYEITNSTSDTTNNSVLPTTELPEFNWEKAEKAVGLELLHRGQPERFHFKFERQAPGMVDSVAAGCGGNGGISEEEDSSVLSSV
jgi:hypothetical protein